MKLTELKQIAKQLDPIALTEERDHYKALYEAADKVIEIFANHGRTAGIHSKDYYDYQELKKKEPK